MVRQARTTRAHDRASYIELHPQLFSASNPPPMLPNPGKPRFSRHSANRQLPLARPKNQPSIISILVPSGCFLSRPILETPSSPSSPPFRGLPSIRSRKNPARAPDRPGALRKKGKTSANSFALYSAFVEVLYVYPRIERAWVPGRRLDANKNYARPASCRRVDGRHSPAIACSSGLSRCSNGHMERKAPSAFRHGLVCGECAPACSAAVEDRLREFSWTISRPRPRPQIGILQHRWGTAISINAHGPRRLGCSLPAAPATLSAGRPYREAAGRRL